MSFSDDLHLKVVGPRRNYDSAPDGEIMSAPIMVDGEVVAYMFASVDPAQDGAGLIYHVRGSKFVGAGSGYWVQRLKSFFEQHAAPLEALQAMLGETGPREAGQLGIELTPYADKFVLDAIVNPRQPEASDRGRERPPLPSPRSLTERVDAVLRGEEQATPDVLAQIDNIDSALRVKPTSEDLIVTMGRTRSSLPDVLETGSIVNEPTFLRTKFRMSDQTPIDAEVSLLLRVPAGTPAIYTRAETAQQAGTLLLARGLQWEVARVIPQDNQQLLVTGRIKPLSAATPETT